MTEEKIVTYIVLTLFVIGIVYVLHIFKKGVDL